MDNIKFIKENDNGQTIYKQEEDKEQPFISQIQKLKRKPKNNNNKLIIFVK